MKLTELINKKINKDEYTWKIEEDIWLTPMSATDDIYFRFGSYSIRATDDYKAINANEDIDDFYDFQVDDEILKNASIFLFNLKLKEELKRKPFKRIKKIKI